MKKSILYLFLFTYTTVLLKPVFPYVTDAMSHLLFFNDHMNTVHKHHGKYHVHSEVAEAAKKEQQEKSTDSLRKETSGNEHIIIEPMLSYSMQETSNHYLSLIVISESKAHTNHDFPPPKM